MASHENRDRVIVWPLDAWRRAVDEKPKGWEHLFFAADYIRAITPSLSNWESIGYVQQGHNRGLLVRSKLHGGYAMYDRPLLRSLISRKVERALQSYADDPDAAWLAAMQALRNYNASNL